jgi:sec-independent protein translocase protein TatA
MGLMPQAMFGLGVPELLIILAVVLLLFGGSRLAGLGKSTGRALKEFKEETRGLKNDKNAAENTPPAIGQESSTPTTTYDTPTTTYDEPPQAPARERDGEYRRDV